MSLAFLRVFSLSVRRENQCFNRQLHEIFLRLLPDGLDKVSRKSKNKKGAIRCKQMVCYYLVSKGQANCP
jgi:hypothetical protein